MNTESNSGEQQKKEWMDDTMSETQLTIGRLQVHCFDEDSEMHIKVGNSHYQPLTIDEAKEVANFFISHIKNEMEANPPTDQFTGQPERFKRPTDEQVVKAAIVFNDGLMDKKELMNMVAMADWIIDRLYENGNILEPSSKEK